MDPYWSPSTVDWNRRFGTGLMQQGTDASPVGHWTQALARALQGGIGGYMTGQANRADAEGKQGVADIYKQGLDRGDGMNKIAAALMGNPWGAEQGQSLANQHMTTQANQGFQRQQQAAQFAHAQRMAAPQHRLLGIQAEAAQRELDAPKVGTADLGPDHARVFYDPRTGNELRRISGPSQGNKALENAVAKTSVDLAENDIKAAYGAQEVISIADQLRTLSQDKKLSSAIGPVMGSPTAQTIVGGFVPFSETLGLANREMNQKIDQLKAQAVLAAQQKMRGLGAVSDADAARVEASVGKLAKARNAQEFKNAVAELERSVQLTLSRGQAAARQFPGLGARITAPAAPADQPNGRHPAAVQAMDEARAAIEAGAPRDAVIKRLRDNGIDPGGL